MAKGEEGRRFFSAELRVEALRRAEERWADGVPLTQAARELGVTDGLLRSWRRKLAACDSAAPADVFPGQGHLPGDEKDARRLERELVRAQHPDYDRTLP